MLVDDALVGLVQQKLRKMGQDFGFHVPVTVQ